MTSPKIIITGLNGLIGWHLYLECKARGLSVYGTYGKAHARLQKEEAQKINLDSSKAVETYFHEISPDYIIHARGICDLDLCEEKPEMAQKINVRGTQIIVEAAKKLASLKKLIFISTDHVFCGNQGNYDEQSVAEPKHVYGRTKKAAEALVANSALPFLVIRPGLVIGESFQGNKGPRDFLFSRIKAQKPTHYFVDEWRTPILATELRAQALDKVLGEDQGIFHLAGKKKMNRFELARQLAEEAGMGTKHVFSRLRSEDKWAHIRPEDLSLTSVFD